MSNSLLNMQEKYYNLLHDNLGSYYTNMKKNNLSLTEFFKKTFDKTCGLTFGEMYEFVENYQNELNRLWNNNLPTVLNDVKQLNGIKTYHFWVPFEDIPKKEEIKPPNIINRVGLYADTILMDDPLWRASAKLQDWEALFRYYKIFTYGFHLLDIEDIIFADVDQPIVAIVPSDIHLPGCKKKYEDFVFQKRLELANTLFNKKFSNEDELGDFFIKKVKSLSDFTRLTKKDTEHETFRQAFKSNVELKTMGHSGLHYDPGDLPLVFPKGLILGDIFFNFASGYISLSLQQYYKSSILDSYPVFENNIALQESNRFLELDHQIFNGIVKNKSNDHLVSANILLNNKFKWLGNVPTELLIKIRKNGDLDEFRLIISDSLNKYHTSKLDNINEIAKDVKYELITAFKRHDKQINAITQKYKFGKWDTAGIIVSGTIGITGFVFPPIALVGSILGGGVTASDVARKYFKKKSEIAELEKRPIGILYEAYKKETDSIA